jgi:GNAT superfamily N-acetyltransferase
MRERTGNLLMSGEHVLELVERPYDHPDADRLLKQFYNEQVNRYGFAEPIWVESETYVRPNGVFVIAYVDGRPGACGGFRWYERSTGTVEIKKFFTVPELRQYGIGRRLMHWLEGCAEQEGAEQIILETGVRNEAAVRLFRDLGYSPIDRYVPSRDPRVNRAFAKVLINPSAASSSIDR